MVPVLIIWPEFSMMPELMIVSPEMLVRVAAALTNSSSPLSIVMLPVVSVKSTFNVTTDLAGLLSIIISSLPTGTTAGNQFASTFQLPTPPTQILGPKKTTSGSATVSVLSRGLESGVSLLTSPLFARILPGNGI